MARTAIFLFFLGLSAAHPQEGRAIGSGPPGPPVKGKNPNPLESRVAAVVKDDDTDPGASEGPQNVGKSGNWKGTPRFLLCDKFTSGSIEQRADKIADHLAKNEDPDSQWYVFLFDDAEGWGTRAVKGETDVMKNACGHDMWVYRREDRFFKRTKCSSAEMRRAATIVKGAVSPGGTNAEVRDNIRDELAAFDVDLLFAVVGGWNDNWNFGSYTDLQTCAQWVDVKVGSGDDYQVFFVLQ